MKTVFLALFLCSTLLSAQPAGYTMYKEITISADQVAGDQPLTGFPVLVCAEDVTLRTVAQRGNVYHADGYDIVFTAEDGTTVLSHQTTAYDRARGRWLGYVNIPSLSNSRDTRILMYYGNSSVSANSSSSDTWDDAYLGVYGFEGNTLDDSGAGNDLTDFRTTNIYGKVGRCRGLFNGNKIPSAAADEAEGQYMQAPDRLLGTVRNFTWSGWIRLWQAETNWERVFDFGSDESRNFFFTLSSGTDVLGQTRARITNSGIPGETGPIITNVTNNIGTWVHWAVTIDDAEHTMQVYRNGQQYGSTTVLNITPADVAPTINNYFGRSQYGVDHLIDADYDEMRMARVSRPAAWIAKEYANQNNPMAFASVGIAQPVPQSFAVLPVELLSFTASVNQRATVDLEWSTSLEENSAAFTLERSRDGSTWETIHIVPGAGSTNSISNYHQEDDAPVSGTSYYRLRQTDFDGHEEVLGIREVEITSNADLSVYPNPIHDRFTLTSSEAISYPVTIYDIRGTDVTSRIRIYGAGAEQRTVSMEGLPAGSYILRVGPRSKVIVKR